MKQFFTEFEIPIFKVTVFVSYNETRGITKANWKKFRKDFETHFEISDNYGAITAGVKQKSSGCYAVLVCFRRLSSAVIMHESVHIAKRVMDLCHIEDEEVEAYLISYIAETINDIKCTAEQNATRKYPVELNIDDLFCGIF